MLCQSVKVGRLRCTERRSNLQSNFVVVITDLVLSACLQIRRSSASYGRCHALQPGTHAFIDRNLQRICRNVLLLRLPANSSAGACTPCRHSTVMTLRRQASDRLAQNSARSLWTRLSIHIA